MSKWSKMTEAEKKAYYAARKARRAAKAKAKPEQAKATAPAKKCAKKCKVCKCAKPEASPEERLLRAIFGKDADKYINNTMSVSEEKAYDAVLRSHREHNAVTRAVNVIGNALLDMMRVFRTDLSKIVIERKPDPAKVPAKK